MNKFSRLVACAMAGTMAFGMGSVCAACGDDEAGVSDDEAGVSDDEAGVSDEKWRSSLTITPDSYTSFTYTSLDYSPFSKEEAAAKGEWLNYDIVMKFDNATGVVYTYSDMEDYYESTQTFKHRIDIQYSLSYGGKYYTWADRDGNTSVQELTEANYNSKYELANISAQMFGMYKEPAMKKIFTYDSSSGAYVIEGLGTSVKLKFLSNGVKLITQNGSTRTQEISFTDINRSTVVVPPQVYTDINDYIDRN